VTRRAAHQLSIALSALGWSDRWDERIQAGAPFDAVIDEQLAAARCVVVVWSTASVTSGWVRSEAFAADEQGTLLPVTFERDLRLPVRFRQIEALFLTGTNLSEPSAENVKMLAAVARSEPWKRSRG
jgi:hypothetical protein